MPSRTRWTNFLAGLSLLLLADTVHAVLPDNGWYWNAGESGRGFNIEIQNNTLFMAGFVYDAQGNQLWIVTGGPMSSALTYSGTAISTSGGQCIGCPYKAPTATTFGTVTVTFTGPTTATIVINGTTIQVERQQFGLDFSNVATPLLGEWATTEGESTNPTYFGERIVFPKTETRNGTLTAVGSRTGDAARPAVGSKSGSSWGILLDYSTTHYVLYTFGFAAFDRIEGLSYFYPKESSLGEAVPFVAQRIKSAAAAAGGDAPGTGKSLPLASGRGVAASAAAAALARELEALIAADKASPSAAAR